MSLLFILSKRVSANFAFTEFSEVLPDRSLVGLARGCIPLRLMASSGRLDSVEKGDVPMSIFPTKILLATDGSREAQLAATTAADLASATNSELHLLSVAAGNPDPVYQIHEAGLRYETYEQALEAVKGETQEVLDEQVRKVREAGGSVKEAHLRIGERRDRAIIHMAEELGAGLIVMGSRGLGGVRRSLMGSVSDSVVRHAHCPVMIVRPEE
jgi:nucleotide-binding universal stress UspA family protein